MRRSFQNLAFDFTSVGNPEFATQSDSAFETLRQVLDLTLGEESALRRGLEDGATRLRDYERENLSDFSVSKGRLSFRIPPSGGFRGELADSMRREQVAILGSARADVFSALTGMYKFSLLPDEFLGAVEFLSEPENLMIKTNLDGLTHRADYLSVERWKFSFYEGRFDHLIDDATKAQFLSR